MKKLLLLVVSVLLVGCVAGGPKSSPEQDSQAKRFIVPTDNTANLYIYRNESFGGAINMDILIDNVRIATTGPYTYIMANLDAGEHKVEGIAAEGTSILNVNLLPNTNKFVWQEVKMGVFGARNVLKEVSEVQGRAGVLESKLLWHEQPKKKTIINTTFEETPTNNYLSSSVVTPKSSSVPKRNKSTVSKSKSSKIYKKRTGYGSSCDCGYSYCYGSRGGRYCITSGGSKSYQ